MDQIFERNVELLEAELGDDLVGLEVSRGECFGFNAVAADVWRRLPASVDDLTAVLSADYDVKPDQCRSDLRDLLHRMVELGVVRVRD